MVTSHDCCICQFVRIHACLQPVSSIVSVPVVPKHAAFVMPALFNPANTARSLAMRSRLHCQTVAGMRASWSLRSFGFAIVDALGQGHWTETFLQPTLAAERYADRKRKHLDTAAKCETAGLYFMPMVFEWQGGMTKKTAASLHRIALAVATAEGQDCQARAALISCQENRPAPTPQQSEHPESSNSVCDLAKLRALMRC